MGGEREATECSRERNAWNRGSEGGTVEPGPRIAFEGRVGWRGQCGVLGEVGCWGAFARPALPTLWPTLEY